MRRGEQFRRSVERKHGLPWPEVLRQLLDVEGRTQVEVAAMLGMTQQAVSWWKLKLDREASARSEAVA